MANNNTTFYDYYYYDGENSCDDFMDFSTISAAFFIVIFIISITGSSLLLFALVRRGNLKNATNLFILNLTCSNLVLTVTLPFGAVELLHRWVFGDLGCKLLNAVGSLGFHSNIILLTAITVDHFITVVLNKWPSKLVRERCAAGFCATAWIVSIVASLHFAIKVKETTTADGEFFCNTEDPDAKLIFLLQMSLLFFLPLIIIIFCCCAILKTVLQFSNRRRNRTVVMVLCIVAAFFICWGPYTMLLFLVTLHVPDNCYEWKSWHIALNICSILAFSHCCINPLFYMLSQNMQRHLLHFLHCDNVRNMERASSSSDITSQTYSVMMDSESK
ncbi:chemokine XC receptor 1-like [Scomber japonicus]|uniref:chemokine XC receptor 1-like n=1 Tax=Scomber japonicus TaxID=13676 RepID=UPI0023066031|nr:chemokine XC receptor 1-like [Scomber japonicus]